MKFFTKPVFVFAEVTEPPTEPPTTKPPTTQPPVTQPPTTAVPTRPTSEMIY